MTNPCSDIWITAGAKPWYYIRALQHLCSTPFVNFSVSNIFGLTKASIDNYTTATKLVGGGYWIHPVCPSSRLSVCMSVWHVNFSCPPSSNYSIFPYSVQMINGRVCRMWCPLTLTYIFKVIRPWLKKSCPLCSMYSSGWILFIFSTNHHYHKRVYRV